MSIYPLRLDKTNFPRILNPRWAKGATIPTTRTRSRTSALTSGWATRRSELPLKTWRPPRLVPRVSQLNEFSLKTLLQYPHGPVPELCLALPCCTAARGTRQKSPLPNYPLGLDKMNFLRILYPRVAKVATIPTTRTGFRT